MELRATNSAMMSRKQAFVYALMAVFLISISFLSGFILKDQLDGNTSEFQILNQAYKILEQHGLKEMPASAASEYGMIRGLLQAYDDPFTIFVEPAQHELESNALQGSFGGIGVRLSQDSQGNQILHPFPGSPAEKAGLLDGDQLISVDDMKIGPNTSTDTIQSAIRGPLNKTVEIGVVRPPNPEDLIFSIIREEISLPSVTWHVAPEQSNIGVIELNLIAASSTEEIVEAVNALKKKGITHFILDLRSNPGGLLSAGVDIARLFLDNGEVLKQQNKGRAVETFRVEQPGPLVDFPLVILIDHGSASAAEIIAGALQAHQRAKIVGSPSFGKDTIQLVFDLDDGSSLHLTSAHWWIPGLEPAIGGNGIQPDILVDADEQNQAPDEAVRLAIQALLGN
jgi:carboxyl-terminal processing protease